ncbi:hypothetical protein INT45_011887 [Circinella minor]|uniref:Uncharacterized protein n=1 Tax=Circinella minor TaxID=1195481 RepID=A0A8H7VBE5_9FUNG|nr:hypothetical protein INT45_011887 [Circinella minor]
MIQFDSDDCSIVFALVKAHGLTYNNRMLGQGRDTCNAPVYFSRVNMSAKDAVLNLRKDETVVLLDRKIHEIDDQEGVSEETSAQIP